MSRDGSSSVVKCAPLNWKVVRSIATEWIAVFYSK